MAKKKEETELIQEKKYFQISKKRGLCYNEL